MLLKDSVNHKHALIIDDNFRNAQVLSRLLAEQGFTSTVVTDPRDTANSIEALEQVDVIFLDLEMPGLNGYQVFEWLKSDARYKHVPTIACTVHSSAINTTHERGFQGFIGKPNDPDRFPDQLTRIMNGQGVWDAV